MDLFKALTNYIDQNKAQDNIPGSLYQHLTGNFQPYLQKQYQDVYGAEQSQGAAPRIKPPEPTPVVDLSVFRK